MRYLFVVFLLLGLAVLPASARAQEDTLTPKVPRGKGEQCVADTDLMRREHMNLLTHQRDITTRLGIRTKRFSLKECVACHAVPGPDSKPVSYQNPNHFCRVCHDYTAVKIDCFECHASRPPVPDFTRSAAKKLSGILAGPQCWWPGG